MAAKLTLGFLGAGKMATALAKGFVEAGIVLPRHITASDPVKAAREAFAREAGAKVVENNQAVAEAADILVLAVKPDQALLVLEDIHKHFSPDKCLFSIVAGLPLAAMESVLGETARLVRVMPNTPALVGASATAYALGPAARKEDEALAEKLFSSVGRAIRVKESLLDAVTGLSGSGPAYVFMIIEALSDGGVAAGLPRPIATELAAQTVFGAAKLLLESGQHPGALKDMVTSPGGTTIEGLHELEKAGVRGALINAVRAAADKSARLGQR